MKFIQDIKTFFGKRRLNLQAANIHKKNKLVSFDQMNEIGIVYDAANKQNEENVQRFAASLREHGKKVFSNIVHARTSSIAMHCYPNPATHMLQIRLPEGQWKTLKIFGMDGRLLDMSRINTAGEISKNIIMVPAGNYLLSVDDGIQSVCMRFIKK